MALAPALAGCLLAAAFRWPTTPAPTAKPTSAAGLASDRQAGIADRLAGIASAGASGDPAQLARLRPLLDDVDRLVRRAAAIALARATDEAALAWALSALAGKSADDPLTAIEVLRAWPRPPAEVTKALEPLLSYGDEPLVRAALTFIEEQDLRPALPPLATASTHDAAIVRATAVRLLGRHSPALTLPILIGRAEDPERRVRIEAVRALGRTGERRAVAPVLRALDTRDEALRAAAAQALGELRAEEAVPVLAPLVRSPMLGPVPRAARRALADIGTPQAVAVLLPLLADGAGSEPPATEIARLLRSVGAPALPALLAALDPHADPRVAIAACDLVADLGAREGIASLARLAELPHPAALASVRALGRLHAQEAVPLLVQLARAPSQGMRTAALAALVEIGDPRGLAVLPAALADPSPSVRALACGVAAMERPPTDAATLAAVRGALADADASVRASAARALAALGDREAVPLLVARIGSAQGDAFVFADAIAAIVDHRDLVTLARALLALEGRAADAALIALAAASRDASPSAVDALARPERRRLVARLLGFVHGGGPSARLAADLLAAPTLADDAGNDLVIAFSASRGELRARLVPALAGNEPGREELARLLSDPAEAAPVRAMAAWALGTLDRLEEPAARALRSTANDPHPAVADNAQAALARAAQAGDSVQSRPLHLFLPASAMTPVRERWIEVIPADGSLRAPPVWLRMRPGSTRVLPGWSWGPARAAVADVP